MALIFQSFSELNAVKRWDIRSTTDEYLYVSWWAQSRFFQFLSKKYTSLYEKKVYLFSCRRSLSLVWSLPLFSFVSSIILSMITSVEKYHLKTTLPSVVPHRESCLNTRRGLYHRCTKGMILTGKHFLHAGDTYTVRTETGESYRVEKIIPHPMHDIAILQINPDDVFRSQSVSSNSWFSGILSVVMMYCHLVPYRSTRLLFSPEESSPIRIRLCNLIYHKRVIILFRQISTLRLDLVAVLYSMSEVR